MSLKNWKYTRGISARVRVRFEKKITLLLLLFPLFCFSQHGVDTMWRYDFIDYESNKILVKDSSTMERFYNKLWNYEAQNSGQVKILQIGDSHVQAGYWSASARGLFHEHFNCGTIARGLVFPYSISNSNGPLNYGIRFNGNWSTQRCIYPDTTCDWGLSGINVSSTSDSLFVKVWCNNRTFDNYYHSKLTVLYQPNGFAHILSATSIGSKVVSTQIDSVLGVQTFIFDKLSDTLILHIHKKDAASLVPFTLQGLILENNIPGIIYGELGVNGAKVNSFLACKSLNKQIKYYNPDLVVLSLGTNDIYAPSFNDSLFYVQYDKLLTSIREALPDATIILTTPADIKRNRKTTIKESLKTRKAILTLAKKHNCGVWDLLKIMGGVESMDKWYAAGLGNSDKVHFNDKGYQLQGMLLYEAIAKGYDEHTKGWKVHKVNVQEEDFFPLLIKKIFSTDPKDPMIFSNYSFWIFFLVLILGYLIVYNRFKARSIYLMIFSLFFYYKSGGFFFAMLVFSTVLDYFLALKIYTSSSRSTKKFLLFLSLFVNLGLLAFFKYSYFVVDIINDLFNGNIKAVNFFHVFSNFAFGTIEDIHDIILPVGISFFTFQTLSYTIDVYYGKLKPADDIWDFGFFITFFPQLVAGPIVRAVDFIPQINQKYNVTQEDFGRAVFLILTGLFKKIVISDFISVNFVDRIFDNPLNYSGFENLMGIYGYAVQIYCDFSGYSDMAIGIAILLGFHLPINFNAPYIATSITDFWRRWHISLSTWLRDYLYIPLGGNKKGKVRTYINLILTMLIGGLWHGPAFKFIFWGGLHGGMLAIERFWKEKAGWKMPKILGIVLTFHFVAACWILFRAKGMEHIGQMFSQIAHHFQAPRILEYIQHYKLVFVLILLAFLAHAFPAKWEKKIELSFGRLNLAFLSIITTLTILLIFQFKSAGIQPFIYFQF
ncbi:MAG: MBOAT family O-acyltransferase [Flavobacteriales bacterium]